MEKFKFTTLHKLIISTAFLPIILYPIYFLLAMIATETDLDNVFATILLPMMAGGIISFLLNTLLFPVGLIQVTKVFKKTKTYHPWLLLISSLIGPVFIYLLVTYLSSQIYM